MKVSLLCLWIPIYQPELSCDELARVGDHLILVQSGCSCVAIPLWAAPEENQLRATAFSDMYASSLQNEIKWSLYSFTLLSVSKCFIKQSKCSSKVLPLYKPRYFHPTSLPIIQPSRIHPQLRACNPNYFQASFTDVKNPSYYTWWFEISGIVTLLSQAYCYGDKVVHVMYVQGTSIPSGVL